jgi:hypothetical protein
VVIDPRIERELGEALPRVSAHVGTAVGVSKLSLEADDAAIGCKVDACLARIARHERANRPRERCDISATNERVQRVVTTTRELDERAKRVVSLKADRRAGACRGERVDAKERIGAGDCRVARERLLERDDGKGARKKPRGGGCSSNSDSNYQEGNSRARQSVFSDSRYSSTPT